MSFTYTDRNAKTVLHSWGRFRGAVEEAVVVGDLLAIKEDADSGFQLANVTNTQTAVAVACQDGEADQTIWMAMIAELKAPTTISTGGVATQTYFAASGDTMGSAVYLSTTDGKLSSTAGAVEQVCGYIVARDRVLVVPTTYLSAASLAISGALTVGTTVGITGNTTLGGTLAVTGTSTFTGAVSFVAAALPSVTNTPALGSTSYQWADLFLGTGSVINFYNGDMTITHSSNLLTVAGGNLTVSGDVAVPAGNKIYLDGQSGSEYITCGLAGHIDMYGSSTIRLYTDAQMQTTTKLYFRDGGLYIYSSANGRLDFVADGGAYHDFHFSGSGLALSGCYLRLHKTDTDGATEAQVWYDKSEDKIKYFTTATRTVVDEETMPTFDASVKIASSGKLYFRTGNVYIDSLTSGRMSFYANVGDYTEFTFTGTPNSGGVNLSNCFLRLYCGTNVGSVEAQVWYDSTTKKIHFWNGTSEQEVTSGTP